MPVPGPPTVACRQPRRELPSAIVSHRHAGLAHQPATHSTGSSDILQNLLLDLRRVPSRGGEPDSACVRRWLQSSSAGSKLVDYLLQEADLLSAAADRLNTGTDEELRAMGMELGKSAHRLRRLAADTE